MTVSDKCTAFAPMKPPFQYGCQETDKAIGDDIVLIVDEEASTAVYNNLHPELRLTLAGGLHSPSARASGRKRKRSPRGKCQANTRVPSKPPLSAAGKRRTSRQAIYRTARVQEHLRNHVHRAIVR